jgi:hypothetical protein
MVERGVFMYWSQVTTDGARKREDKRPSMWIECRLSNVGCGRIRDH